MLQEMPIGCRLGPRCPFAQKKCIQKPLLKKFKQREFACHFPINFREVNANRKAEFEPVVVEME